jgi:starch-binding outer membrane protein, SusD/RagB family
MKTTTIKQYSIVALCICLVLTTASCKKYLDTHPLDNASTDTYYSNATEINFALAGIYSNIKNSSLGRDWMQLNNATSDESYQRSPTVSAPSSFSSASSNGTVSAYWNGCYQGINYANTFLENIANSKGKVDQATIDKATGEALFLRGYYYFLLVQWYGGVPLRTTASKTVAEGQLERSTPKEVYDQIIADMTQAEALLKNQTFASLGYSERVTVDAVQGMLARVCLHAAGYPVNDTKRYDDARIWANKLISAGTHSLLPSFKQAFSDEAANKYNTENIWELGYSYTGPAVTQNQGGPVACFVGVRMISEVVSPVRSVDTGFCEGNIMPFPRLYKAYAPGDLRRERTISNYQFAGTNTTVVQAARTYYDENTLWERWPAKWRREEEDLVSRGQLRLSAINFPLLRYSDVLLMYAEAENQVNGPTTAAYTAVNQVRRRGYSTTNILNNIIVTNGAATNYTVAPAITITGGGGTGAAAVAFVASGKITSITVVNQGSGYTSAPTVTIGRAWAASTAYALNDHVFISGRLYRVTTAGISTATAPTNTSGASVAATTGAVFTYAGDPATAVAVLSNHTANIDLPAGLTKDQFQQAIMDERYRELAFECLRYQDLKRWGILYTTVKSMANDISGLNPNVPAAPTSTSGNAIVPVNNISTTSIYWPIPLTETTLNKKMTQNPGY